MSGTLNNPKIIVKFASVLILFIGYWLCCVALGLLFTILVMIQSPSISISLGTLSIILLVLIIFGTSIIYSGTRMWQKWPTILKYIAFVFSLSGIGASILMYLYRTIISGQSNQIQWAAMTVSFLVLGIINLIIGFTLILFIRRTKSKT